MHAQPHPRPGRGGREQRLLIEVGQPIGVEDELAEQLTALRD